MVVWPVTLNVLGDVLTLTTTTSSTTPAPTTSTTTTTVTYANQTEYLSTRWEHEAVSWTGPVSLYTVLHKELWQFSQLVGGPREFSYQESTGQYIYDRSRK